MAKEVSTRSHAAARPEAGRSARALERGSSGCRARTASRDVPGDAESNPARRSPARSGSRSRRDASRRRLPRETRHRRRAFDQPRGPWNPSRRRDRRARTCRPPPAAPPKARSPLLSVDGYSHSSFCDRLTRRLDRVRIGRQLRPVLLLDVGRAALERLQGGRLVRERIADHRRRRGASAADGLAFHSDQVVIPRSGSGCSSSIARYSSRCPSGSRK
jgi:hypothetical protein